MRIDHLLVTTSLTHRVVWAKIDREARKGNPVPSDHTPLVIHIDSPGHPFDAGWGFSGFANRGTPGKAVMSDLRNVIWRGTKWLQEICCPPFPSSSGSAWNIYY